MKHGVTREDDEAVLRMIALRIAGYNTTQIGDMFGTTSENVRTKINRVRAADIAESNEPDAAAAYWSK